jgi:4a-hydroxytetrahydrobiopterin dehydratase
VEEKEALSEVEIKKRLVELPQWKKNGKAIQRVIEFQEYLEGIDFVRLVAEMAEGLSHHPDMEIRYTRVSVSCSTHHCKGITVRDFELAHRIEKLIEERLMF